MLAGRMARQQYRMSLSDLIDRVRFSPSNIGHKSLEPNVRMRIKNRMFAKGAELDRFRPVSSFSNVHSPEIVTS
jgi:predicted GTPase